MFGGIDSMITKYKKHKKFKRQRKIYLKWAQGKLGNCPYLEGRMGLYTNPGVVYMTLRLYGVVWGSYPKMAGWMDVRLDVWMHGWIDGWMHIHESVGEES